MNTKTKEAKQSFWAKEWNSIKHPSAFTRWYLSNFHFLAIGSYLLAVALVR